MCLKLRINSSGFALREGDTKQNMRSKKYICNPHTILITKVNWHLLIPRKVLREHGFEENSNCNSYIIEIYNDYIIVI